VFFSILIVLFVIFLLIDDVSDDTEAFQKIKVLLNKTSWEA